MSENTASLARFLAPRSIALIGASPDRSRIRGQLLHMLREKGYAGRLCPVNPSHAEIDGLPCVPSVAAIGAPVDLAMLAIPAPQVLAALTECAAAGVRHALIITSGFAEQGGAEERMQQEIAALARRSGMRICGPNTEGFHNEIAHVSATFSPALETAIDAAPVAHAKRIGIVAQSGGMAFALYHRGRSLGLPFSHVISTGNEVDLTASEFFDFLVRDDASDIVLLFLETVRAAPRFLAAAGEAAQRGKPVIAVKIGRSAVGERAAVSHTASMTGWNAAYHAVFRKYGMIAAHDPDEAMAIAGALATVPAPRGDRVAVLSASGGAAAWMADTLGHIGLAVPELGGATQAALRQFIPPYGSARNPVDITAQAVREGGYPRALEILAASDEIDMVVAAMSLASDRRIILDRAAIERITAPERKPVLFYSYTLPSSLARRSFAEAGALLHAGLAPAGAAVRALAERARYRQPRAQPAVPTEALAGIREALATGRPIAEHRAKALLERFGISMPERRLATSGDEAAEAAAALGFPVALKIQSPAIAHKTEWGGIRLDLADRTAVRAAYAAIFEAVRRRDSGAPIEGVLVERMAKPGIEMIVAAIRDAVFGPLIMIGAGGVAAEILKDTTYRLAPIDAAEAREMIGELAIFPLLAGHRGAPAADLDALAQLASRLSLFAAGLADRVAEIELNPIRIHAQREGCTIIDALLATVPRAPRGAAS